VQSHHVIDGRACPFAEHTAFLVGVPVETTVDKAEVAVHTRAQVQSASRRHLLGAGGADEGRDPGDFRLQHAPSKLRRPVVPAPLVVEVWIQSLVGLF
jgi:hypothetical protein